MITLCAVMAFNPLTSSQGEGVALRSGLSRGNCKTWTLDWTVDWTMNCDVDRAAGSSNEPQKRRDCEARLVNYCIIRRHELHCNFGTIMLHLALNKLCTTDHSI